MPTPTKRCHFCPLFRMYILSSAASGGQGITRVSTVCDALVLTAVLKATMGLPSEPGAGLDAVDPYCEIGVEPSMSC